MQHGYSLPHCSTKLAETEQVADCDVIIQNNNSPSALPNRNQSRWWIRVFAELCYASKKDYQLKKDDRTIKLHHRST
jgi:hypothetical protein